MLRRHAGVLDQRQEQVVEPRTRGRELVRAPVGELDERVEHEHARDAEPVLPDRFGEGFDRVVARSQAPVGLGPRPIAERAFSPATAYPWARRSSAATS